VETDTFYEAVQIPSVCQLPPGSNYTLARGTPLVQVVPILRESWTSSANLVDDAKLQKTIQSFAANPHEYKDVHWRKIEYG
jgi:hypothetical protein